METNLGVQLVQLLGITAMSSSLPVVLYTTKRSQQKVESHFCPKLDLLTTPPRKPSTH